MADYFGGNSGRGRNGDDFNYSDNNNFDNRYNRGSNDSRGNFDNSGRQTSGRRLDNLPPLSRDNSQFQPINRANEQNPNQSRPATTMPSQSVKGSSVVIYSPQTYNDVQTLIDYLKRQEPVIIDFGKIGGESAQRILDFMSGAIYALSGSMQRISQSIFLLTPTGVSITIPLDQLRNSEGKK